MIHLHLWGRIRQYIPLLPEKLDKPIEHVYPSMWISTHRSALEKQDLWKCLKAQRALEDSLLLWGELLLMTLLREKQQSLCLSLPRLDMLLNASQRESKATMKEARKKKSVIVRKGQVEVPEKHSMQVMAWDEYQQKTENNQIRKSYEENRCCYVVTIHKQ